MVAVSEEVERLTSALRENSMSIRMLPHTRHLREVPAAGT